MNSTEGKAPYQPPAAPVIIGGVEAAENTPFAGGAEDGGISYIYQSGA